MGISRPEHLLTRRAGIRANGTRRRRLLRFRAAALAVLLVSATAAADSAAAQNAAPLRPTGLEAAAVSHDSVTLNWDASDDDSITGYRILRRDIVNQPPGTFATVEDDTASADASYIDDTVQPETRYAYRIVALSDAGESRRSGYVNVTTPAEPAEPSEPTPPGDEKKPVSDPDSGEEPATEDGQEQTGADELEVWGGVMTVGSSQYAGAPLFGYSRLASPRLGSMDSERIDFGGSTYFTHFVAFSPQYGTLWFGSGAPLGTMEGLVLRIEGQQHAFADADEAQGIHGTWIYRWESLPADSFAWEVGDTVAMEVVNPDLEGAQLHGLKIFGLGDITFDPDKFRYKTTADPDAATARVRAQSSAGTEIEVLGVRSDRDELGFEPATENGSFQQVSLSQTGDTVVVVKTTADDNTQNTYVVHVSPSDGDGDGGGGDGDGVNSVSSKFGTMAAPGPAAARGAKPALLPGAARHSDNQVAATGLEPHTGEGTVWEGRMHCLPPDVRHLGASFDIPWTEDYLRGMTRSQFVEDPEADVSMYRLSVRGAGADQGTSYYLTPGFYNWTESRLFTTVASPDASRVTVVPCPADPMATFEITPADADPDTDGHQIELPAPQDGIGPTRTSVVIAVRAANGMDMDTYTVNIERPVPVPPDLPQLGRGYELVWWSSLTVSASGAFSGYGARAGGGELSDDTIHSRHWPGIGTFDPVTDEFLYFLYEFTVTELYYRTVGGADRLRFNVPVAQIPDGWILVVDGTRYPVWSAQQWGGTHDWDDVASPNWSAGDEVLVALYRSVS